MNEKKGCAKYRKDLKIGYFGLMNEKYMRN